MSLAQKLPLVVLPLVAFAAATLGTLAATGHLDRAPVVGRLFAGHKSDKHSESEHGEAAHGESHGEPAHGEGEHGESKPEADSHEGAQSHEGAGREASADAKSAAGDTAATGSHGTNVVAQVFELPRPYEAEELDGLVAKLGAAREQLTTHAKAAQDEREALTLLAKEMDERRADMERIMSDIERDRVALDAERLAHDTKLESLPDSEVEALRPVAKAYEEMSPEAAAERLGRLDPIGATKVLALMRPKKSAKVLEATEPARAAEISRRLGALKRGDAIAKSGS